MTDIESEHMKKVYSEFKILPDTKLTNGDVYDEFITLIVQSEHNDGTAESLESFLHTMKLITIQMCDKLVKHEEKSQYEQIQEQYK